jgi:hypothetical protein
MDISFGAIAISIIIGVASNLLTPYASGFFGKIFQSVRTRNEEKKKVFEKTVQYILKDSQEEAILRIRYLQRSLVSLIFMLGGFIFMMNGNILQVIGGFIIFLLGDFHSTKAGKLGKILEEVWERRKSKFKGIDLD